MNTEQERAEFEEWWESTPVLKENKRTIAEKAYQAGQTTLLAERDTLAAECQEQARLNGMGAEREARLMAERDALREALEMMVEMVEMNGFGRAYAMDVARAALAQGEV